MPIFKELSIFDMRHRTRKLNHCAVFWIAPPLTNRKCNGLMYNLFFASLYAHFGWFLNAYFWSKVRPKHNLQSAETLHSMNLKSMRCLSISEHNVEITKCRFCNMIRHFELDFELKLSLIKLLLDQFRPIFGLLWHKWWFWYQNK